MDMVREKGNTNHSTKVSRKSSLCFFHDDFYYSCHLSTDRIDGTGSHLVRCLVGDRIRDESLHAAGRSEIRGGVKW